LTPLRIFKKLSAEEKKIKIFLRKNFRVRPRNLVHYKLALTHASSLDRHSTHLESNERLEFLGDAILDAFIAIYFFENYPGLSEGALTKKKAALVSRSVLNQIGMDLKLEELLRYNINADYSDTSLLGNALEALIGAIYLDQGYIKTKKALEYLYSNKDIFDLAGQQKDYKSLLHEWGQQRKKEVHFRTLNETREEGRNLYEVEVLIGGVSHGKATDSSKKKAQKKVAEIAAKKLKIVSVKN